MFSFNIYYQQGVMEEFAIEAIGINFEFSIIEGFGSCLWPKDLAYMVYECPKNALKSTAVNYLLSDTFIDI